MGATPLTPSVAFGPGGGPYLVPRPPVVGAGMMLIACLAVDSGGLSGIIGGDSWQPLGRVAGPTTHLSAVDVYWRLATGDEPDNYTALVGTTGDGIAVVVPFVGANSGPPQVVAGPLYTNTFTVNTPGLTPDAPSGAILRWAAGIPNEADITWAPIPGYTELADVQSEDEVGGQLVWAPIASNAPVPPVSHTATAPLQYGGGLTLFVTSAAVQVPDPPDFPAFTPGLGSATMRYTVHDFLTGATRGEIVPAKVYMDRRIGEPGTWRGQLPIPNPREADKAAEIIPRDPNDLTSGPGMIVVHCWRAGVLWGVYWLHTAIIFKDERGQVYLDLQGSTLDGYLQWVKIEQDAGFAGDQIDAARQLLAHMQATPASNAGLAFAAGVSGTVRTLLAARASNSSYGRSLQDFARAADGFEYVVNPTLAGGSIQRLIDWGAPKLINLDAEHVFVEAVNGGDVTTWREERSIFRGGTRWGAIGGTAPTDVTSASAPARSILVSTPHIDAGWPIVDQRINHPSQSTNQTELDAYAAYWSARAPGAPRVFSANVVIGKNTTLNPNGLGDAVRFVLNNPWHPITSEGAASFNLRQRLIGWGLTPAERGAGKDKVQLITEQEVLEG
ncbi:hypothetical protein ACBJ59_12110 [Nonomuraea sp. MTCD27]|uniref:hypothetical protein n=1 Tax=Nonomuraea sp. MTCD27 TaxID=1676747 RepID=UPI0035C24478